MAFSESDDLLEGLEKIAMPADFAGPIPTIWSAANMDEGCYLERPEDPFDNLIDLVHEHIECGQSLEREVADLALDMIEIKETLAHRKRAAAEFKVWVCQPQLAKHPEKAPCPVCTALDGQRVAVHEEFPFVGQVVLKDGTRMGRSEPPAHPNCNCLIHYISYEGPVPDQNTPGLQTEQYSPPQEQQEQQVQEQKTPEEQADDAEEELDDYYENYELKESRRVQAVLDQLLREVANG